MAGAAATGGAGRGSGPIDSRTAGSSGRIPAHNESALFITNSSFSEGLLERLGQQPPRCKSGSRRDSVGGEIRGSDYRTCLSVHCRENTGRTHWTRGGKCGMTVVIGRSFDSNLTEPSRSGYHGLDATGTLSH